MKQFFSLILSFAPWLAFLILAGHTLTTLRISLVVAAVLTLIMAVLKLHRGAVMYAGVLFFSFALVAIVWQENLWVIERLNILANGTLYFTTLLTMILGKPFTEDYAREAAPPEHWNTAGFVRSCYITTSVWSGVFLLNLMAGVMKYYDRSISDFRIEIFNYAVLLGGVIFTNIYTQIVKRKRSAARE